MSAADRLSLLHLEASHPSLHPKPTYGLRPGEGKATDTEFTLFPLLPWEIRQQIWRCCISPDDEYTLAHIVRLRQYIFARDGYSYSTGSSNRKYQLHNYMKKWTISVCTISACHESRLLVFQLVKKALENETWMKEWLQHIGASFEASLGLVKTRSSREERFKINLIEGRRIPRELLFEKCSLVYNVERLNLSPILLDQFIFWRWEDRTLAYEEKEMLSTLEAAVVHLRLPNSPDPLPVTDPPGDDVTPQNDSRHASKLKQAMRSCGIAIVGFLRSLTKKVLKTT